MPDSEGLPARVRDGWLPLTLAVVWLTLGFGSLIILTLQQARPKLVDLVGG